MLLIFADSHEVLMRIELECCDVRIVSLFGKGSGHNLRTSSGIASTKPPRTFVTANMKVTQGTALAACVRY